MPEPIKQVQAVPPGNNMSIWGTRPMLRNIPGGQYQGRVFVEVFERDVQVAICGADRVLANRAWQALQEQFTALRDSAVPWSAHPASGTVAGQQFLGRVVIELWQDQAVVGITGADTLVMERARQRLSTI